METTVKILVLSDSHGRDSLLYEILYRNMDAEVIIHLGDGEEDFEICRDTIPNFCEKRLIQVKGNCDWYSSLAVTSFDNIGGFRFYNTHGYVQGVKFGVGRLLKDARDNNRNVALFGHTHQQYYDSVDGVHLFNPGAVRNYEYGVITIDEGSGEIRFTHMHG